MAYFEINDLKVSFRSVDGLKNVLHIDHLEIEKGQAYGLVGESGSGKSVLALTIFRLLTMPPGVIESGSVILDGVDLLKKSSREMEDIRGKKMAMIFQDPMSTLNPVFTVGQQISNAIIKNQNMKKKEAEAKALDMIRLVKLPDAENVMKKYPHELSGGQRQRVIIAIALSCGAEFLIADEPTRNLDVTIQAGILKLLADLQKEMQVTVLYIANNLNLVTLTCDHVGLLYQGRIVEQAVTREIIHHPQNAYTRRLLQSLPDKEKKPVSCKGDPLLRLEHLKKYYPIRSGFFSKVTAHVKAVDDVSIDLYRGETLGIVGESGCGKTTLVNTLLCLEQATGGQVFFDGHKITDLKEKELRFLRKELQIVFQDPFWSLDPRWLLKDIVGEPLKVFHPELKGEAFMKKVEDTLELVGLPKEGAYQYPHEFSAGQRQRIAIARAIILEPKLLILDEPTSSLDVLSQAQILTLLEELKKKLHMTYILISHDLGVVHYMSDKIAVMYLGKLVEFGDADAIFRDPYHPYTEALFGSIPTLENESFDELEILEGTVPSPIHPPSGCYFHTRCPYVCESCKEKRPVLEVVGHDREVACPIAMKKRSGMLS